MKLDPTKTALILIDLQNGLRGRTLEPHSFNEVLANGVKIAQAFREKGGTVVLVRVDIANMLVLPTDEPPRSNAGSVPPSASDLVAELGAQEQDLLITKRFWGAFAGTELEARLRAKGVETVVIGGIATNYGVESTARESAGFGFATVLVEDAMSSLSAEMHQFAVEHVFPRLGRVRSTAEILESIA